MCALFLMKLLSLIYTIASEQGHVKAQYLLGSCYYNGQGVDVSDLKAREWITKAAAQGYEIAINTLKQLDETKEEPTWCCISSTHCYGMSKDITVWQTIDLYCICKR